MLPEYKFSDEKIEISQHMQVLFDSISGRL